MSFFDRLMGKSPKRANEGKTSEVKRKASEEPGTELKTPEYYVEGFIVIPSPPGWKALGNTDALFQRVVTSLEKQRDLSFFLNEEEFKKASNSWTVRTGAELLKIDLVLPIADPSNISNPLSITPGKVTNTDQIHRLTFGYSTEEKPTIVWNSKFNAVRKFFDPSENPRSPGP